MQASGNTTLKSRPTKRKPVEIVVFEDPAKPKGPKKTRNSKQLLSKNPKKAAKEDFKAIFNDVKEFGVTGLSKKDRKKYDEEKAQALGARKPKGQKVPYPILQYASKVRKQREEEKAELDKEMGIFSKKKKEKTASTTHGGWWINEPVKIEDGRNSIKIKQADLKKLKKSK